VLAEGLIQQARRGRLLTGRKLDLDPAVAQDPRPPSSGLLTRIVGGDHDPRDPRLENRLGARRLTALMSTGLQCHVHRRPGRVFTSPPAVGKSRTLSMQPPQLSVKSLANHLAITHHDSSNKRIRTHPTTPALRKLKRPPEMGLVRACELRIHRTD
jgi:hypothetical protein